MDNRFYLLNIMVVEMHHQYMIVKGIERVSVVLAARM